MEATETRKMRFRGMISLKLCHSLKREKFLEKWKSQHLVCME